MVRLEKLLYERILNIRALKRERIIGAPQKWYAESRSDSLKVAANKLFNEGITATILRWLEPFLAKYTYQFMRDIALQRGFAMEDLLLHTDRELRRDVFFEAVVRQSCHPYQFLFFRYRRARFYKIERAVRGFYVPEWIRKEGEERLLHETTRNIHDWEDFVYMNWMSDQTPQAHFTVLPKWNPLIMFIPYGIWRSDAWDRYFYNEVVYDKYSDEQVKKAIMNPFPHIDFNTDSGRRRFEAEVERFIKLYPGSIVREGEKFNFKEFYATEALINNRDLSRHDPQLIDRMRSDITAAIEDRREEKVSKKKKILGTQLPEFMKPPAGQSIF